MVTVNTSPLVQAVVAGHLLTHDFSLASANAAVTQVYRRNLDLLLSGLHARFAGTEVRWSAPTGGYFVVLSVPFRVDDALLEHSARQHQVLWTPMVHFYPGGSGGDHELRLSCGGLTPEQIETGLDRIAKLVEEQTAGS
jgi:(S)-3,5-dihydroxyphenylglycine transaminase